MEICIDCYSRAAACCLGLSSAAQERAGCQGHKTTAKVLGVSFNENKPDMM